MQISGRSARSLSLESIQYGGRQGRRKRLSKCNIVLRVDYRSLPGDETPCFEPPSCELFSGDPKILQRGNGKCDMEAVKSIESTRTSHVLINW